MPLGTPDRDWTPPFAARGLIAMTRDRRIRTRPAEGAKYGEHGIRSIGIGAKRDLGKREQLEMFVQHEARLRREIIKLGPGPWALAMSPHGLRPLWLHDDG